MQAKKEIISKLYDKTADIYDSRYGKIQEEKYRIMLEDLQLKKPILDLGCGTGLLQKFFKAKLIGLDISFKMLKRSKEYSIQGDMENLPFKNNSFATVLSFTALQNLENAEAMLREVKRILKPDGIFVLTVLSKFVDKLAFVEKYFKILEMKTCGEDVGLILMPNK
ncbi:MAG: class I SAM-dependent methyltransferase [Candidatus Nanoarchaeia archaeon]